MYLDALSFLEDERETFRPFEALLDLSDEQLDQPVEAAGGWSGRDLMGPPHRHLGSVSER